MEHYRTKVSRLQTQYLDKARPKQADADYLSKVSCSPEREQVPPRDRGLREGRALPAQRPGPHLERAQGQVPGLLHLVLIQPGAGPLRRLQRLRVVHAHQRLRQGAEPARALPVPALGRARADPRSQRRVRLLLERIQFMIAATVFLVPPRPLPATARTPAAGSEEPLVATGAPRSRPSPAATPLPT
jgi:hypothetical protein